MRHSLRVTHRIMKELKKSINNPQNYEYISEVIYYQNKTYIKSKSSPRLNSIILKIIKNNSYNITPELLYQEIADEQNTFYFTYNELSSVCSVVILTLISEITKNKDVIIIDSCIKSIYEMENFCGIDFYAAASYTDKLLALIPEAEFDRSDETTKQQMRNNTEAYALKHHITEYDAAKQIGNECIYKKYRKVTDIYILYRYILFLFCYVLRYIFYAV